MIWEVTQVKGQAELLEEEYHAALKLFEVKDKKARLIENDTQRSVG